MPCWFELTTRDAKRGAEFLAALADLSVQSMAMGEFDYRVLNAGEHAVAGVLPMVGAKLAKDLPNHWVIYFAVDDVDACVELVKQHGGAAPNPPMDTPMGRLAIVNDPSGAVFMLFRSEEGKTDGTNPIGDGAFVWCELGVPDPSSVAKFYASVFGWRSTEHSADGFTYREMRTKSGTPIASIFRACADGASEQERAASAASSAPSSRPAWRPYLQVADVAKTCERAGKLGAEVEWQPMDVPRFGRFAGVIDPSGTPLTLLQPMTGWGP